MKDPDPQQLCPMVRTRPGMFLGSVQNGMDQCVYELVSNVLDLYVADQATVVEIAINGTTITVIDDGPGLPFDQPSDRPGISIATCSLTHFHSSRSEDNHVPHVHLTSVGVGLAPVNMVSAKFTVTSWRNGTLWQQSFRQGIAQGDAIALAHDNEQDNHQRHRRGTTIEVMPDPEIFGDAEIHLDVIRKMMFEAAHLFSGLTIRFQDECFRVANGLRSLGLILIEASLVAGFYRMPPFHCTISHQNVWIETAMWAGTYFERQQMINQLLVTFDSDLLFDYEPYLDKTSDLSTQIMSWFQKTATPERGAYVQGACDLSTQIVSWVNGVKTVCHGSHVDGALQAVESIDWPPVFILIHVVMHDPEWAGPTRSQLNAPHITEIVKEALLDPLRQYHQKYLEPWKQGNFYDG